MKYNSGSGAQPVSVRNIAVTDTEIDGAAAVLNLVGLESDPMIGIHLSRCTFTGIKGADIVGHAEDLTFDRVTVNGNVVS
ncbi:hypothetical protein ACIRQP_32245 [Streptomyces sp. NPDC102274]|uniref:hypothetical protein n=1 Tax=Streptomyces sp. NPDC102274 TaxID=3366151 RepID=UPI003810F850